MKATEFWKKPYVSVLALAALQLMSSGAMSQQGPASSSAVRSGDVKPQLVVQLGHARATTSVAFSSDGEVVLTGSNDGTARLWRVANGREIRVFKGHTDIVTGVAIRTSDTGCLILTGSLDGTARLWDSLTGEELQLFRNHEAVLSVALSPDLRFVLTGDKYGSSLWHARTGQEALRFKGEGASYVVAFSPDGNLVFTAQNRIGVIWDATTKERIKLFKGHGSSITCAAFSPDGRTLFTGSGSFRIGPWPVLGDETVRQWDIETEQQIRQISSRFLTSMAISPDATYLLTWNYFSTGELWNVTTGMRINSFKREVTQNVFGGTSVAFSPDSHLIVASSLDIFDSTVDRAAHLWNVEAGKELGRLEGYSSSVNAFSLSKTNLLAVGSGNGSVALWNLEKGLVEHWFKGDAPINSVSFSTDGDLLLTGSGVVRLVGPPANRVTLGDSNAIAQLWSIDSRKEKGRFGEHPGAVNSVAISQDGRFALIGHTDIAADRIEDTATLWDTATGKRIRSFGPQNAPVTAVRFSQDGRFAVTAGSGTRLWDVSSGSPIHLFEEREYPKDDIDISSDGRFIMSGSSGERTRIWNLITREKSTELPEPALSVSFSENGRMALTGGVDGKVSLWAIPTGTLLRQFIGHSGAVKAVSFSIDGRYVITGGEDNTLRFWSLSSGSELCRMISLQRGDWVVITPEGRFDTNNLEEIKGLHWIMPDDPMKPLPVEIFMRDYYEPRLLPRILSAEKFREIRNLSELNRIQPQVSIANIERQKDKPDLVTVTVEVSNASRQFKLGGKAIIRQSGVFDIRLFRDGQIVSQLPQVKLKTTSSQTTLSEEQRRKQWQEEARVKPAEQVKQETDGSYTITFKDIHLPQKAGLNEVEFSVYAFNEDRVKSETSKKSYTLPKEMTPHNGKAYILTVGVNRFQNSAWDLRYAANDARDAQRLLVEKIRRVAEYEDVIGVSLVSDSDNLQGEREATKANIKVAIEEIARRARPEDTVIIYYSSHGYADRRGQFYMFPTDIGEGSEKEINASVLDRCISSEELTEWLRGVDAGEMVMVVDACQSAGTVKGEEGGEFKPGPMGSRGLGQLAYDKGMRILAASQADDFAFELDELQHGLLTYALMKDGIEGRKADKNKDKQITLNEALLYSLDRVPVLYEAMRKNELGNLFRAEGSRGPVVTGPATSLRKKSSFQKPALFDFAKTRREVVLVR